MMMMTMITIMAMMAIMKNDEEEIKSMITIKTASKMTIIMGMLPILTKVAIKTMKSRRKIPATIIIVTIKAIIIDGEMIKMMIFKTMIVMNLIVPIVKIF